MNKFQLSRRQALLIFLICTISSKLQLLPCLLSGAVGKDLWIILLFGGCIDIFFLFLTILINKICPNTTIHDMLRNSFGKVFSFIVGALLLIYLIITATLPYEAVRDVFASNLFDSIPWQIFSLFLLFCVGYLAFSGIKTLGRTAELYHGILFFCVVGLVILGAIHSDFSQVLPIGQSTIPKMLQTYVSHSLWFGDYMIFFVLIGRIKDEKTGLKFKDLLLFAAVMVFYAVAYIAFYGLYTITAATQTSLLSSISAFSMLNLDIGRIDWFLVLLSQIASVISCCTYISCAADCLFQLSRKKNYTVCVILCSIFLYASDLFFFKNIEQGIVFYTKYTGSICLIIQTAIPIICLVAAIIVHKKKRRQLCEN